MSQVISGSNANEATGLTIDHIIMGGMQKMLFNLAQNGGLPAAPNSAMTTICNIDEVNRLKGVDPEGAQTALTEAVESFARTLASYIGYDEKVMTIDHIIMDGMQKMLFNLAQNGGLPAAPNSAMTTICNIDEVNRLKGVDPEGAQTALTEAVESFARTLASYIGYDEKGMAFSNI